MPFDDFIVKMQYLFIAVVIGAGLFFGITDAMGSPVDEININYSADEVTELPCIFTAEEGTITFVLEQQDNGLFYKPPESTKKQSGCVYYSGVYSFVRQDLLLFRVNHGRSVLLKLVDDNTFQVQPRDSPSGSAKSKIKRLDFKMHEDE